jgi:rRNA maturation RNase YbeY
MIKINVIVKDKTWLKFIKNPDTYLKKKIKIIQRDNYFKRKKYHFCVLLSGAKEIKYFNKKFRKKNNETDILSFPSQNKKDLKILSKSNLEIYLGDIIINFKKMDTTSKKSFKKHFDILWIHGLLHLFGHDHKKESNYQKMNAIEKKLLNRLI